MLSRSRPESCVSDLLLDRLLAQELAPDEAAGAREHMAGCAACRARLEALEADRARFLSEVPALGPLGGAKTERAARPPAKSPERAKISTIWAGLATVAAAAALVTVSRFHVLDSARVSAVASSVEQTRSKGSRALGFYVTRGVLSERGASGDWLGPGEHLQFYYSTPSPGYLALLSVDGAKQVSVYYPAGDAAAPIAAGAEVPLASSVVLDDTLGDEVVYGVFCSQPFELGRLRRELTADPERAPDVAGCEVEQVRYRKRKK